MNQHYFNYYFGPIEMSYAKNILEPRITMQLPHKYLDFDNESIKLGAYSDYLWARQERMEYKNRKMREDCVVVS